MNRLAILFPIAVMVVSSAAPARAGDIDRKLEGLTPGDWQPWIDVADRLIQDGRSLALAAARHLLEGCARAGDEAFSRQALARLAEIHLAGDLHPCPDAASRFLLELARRTGDAGAIERLAALRQPALKEKRDLLDIAAKCRETGDWSKAMAALRKAVVIPFDIRAEVGESITEKRILEMLSDTAAQYEALRHARDAGGPPQCQKCQGRGAMICPKCKGKGRVKEINPQGGGRLVYVACPKCHRLGIVLCAECTATGFNLDKLDEETRRNFAIFAEVARQAVVEKELADALEVSQRALLSLPMNLPTSFLPDKPEHRSLFPFLRRVGPPTRFSNAWRAGEIDRVDRLNMLVDYAVAGARSLSPYRPVLELEQTSPAPRSWAPLIVDTVPLPPERIAAFPGFYNDRWVAARGVYRGDDSLIGFEAGRFFKVEGLAGHDVRFFAWKKYAKNHTRVLATLSRKLAPLASLSHAYPFDAMEKSVTGLSQGQEVEVFGRFIHVWPEVHRKFFEVWWVGAPGDLPEGAPRADFGEADAAVGPGPLLEGKEEWAWRKINPERHIAEGNARFRRALDLMRALSGPVEDFTRLNESALLLLQKARAFYERAYEKRSYTALRQLIILVNRHIADRIAAARAR